MVCVTEYLVGENALSGIYMPFLMIQPSKCFLLQTSFIQPQTLLYSPRILYPSSVSNIHAHTHSRESNRGNSGFSILPPFLSRCSECGVFLFYFVNSSFHSGKAVFSGLMKSWREQIGLHPLYRVISILPQDHE